MHARSPGNPVRSLALRGLAVALALAGLALLLAGCGASANRRTPRASILVAPVERRTVPYEIEATGTVEPREQAAVTAQVGGLITRVTFREGDDVAAGQRLVQIDPRPFQAAVDRAAAALARDRALARTARLDYERANSLSGQQVLAESELDQRRAQYESLEANARADSAALVTARIDLSNATVRAPISGRTGHLSARVGNVLKANETAAPLVTIVQLRPILVHFTLTQTDLPALSRVRGKSPVVLASVGAGDSTWIEGRLTFVDNAVDPASGTLLVKGEFPNRDGRLWPGAFVRVRLRLYEEAGVTVVPSVAVSNSQSGPYVYVVKPDTTVESRTVTVERTWGELSVISSGVEPGEIVVTDGQLRLSPGARATIRPARKAAGEGSTARVAESKS
jgi:multidrug efflux system membrane fusion protein